MWLKLTLLTVFVLLVAANVEAQKTCARVSSTSQNCLVTLSWTASIVAPSNDAPTNYLIQRKDGSTSYAQIGTVATVVTFQNAFTDAGNVAHCWTVIAKNAAGSSTASNEVCWSTPAILALPPAVPQGLTISAISSQTLRITWDDVDNEKGYEVWGRAAKGQGRQYAKLVSLLPDTTTWDWTGRKAYTSYCIELLATGDPNSPFSLPACATTSK